MQHFETEHRQLLDSEQKLRPVHFEKFRIADGRCRAEAAMLRIDQSSDTETTAGADGFAEFTAPGEGDGAADDAIENITMITWLENDVARLDMPRRPAA